MLDGGLFWFSDEQWARIEPLFQRDTRAMPRVDDRRVLSGIVPALKSGDRWSGCPEPVYGPKYTLYNRFRRWAERGVWERVFASLARVEGVPARLFIDSSCTKVLRTAGGAKREAMAQGIGITIGGRNTKLDAVCDEKGRPHVLLLTSGTRMTPRLPCWLSMPCRHRSIWSPTRATTATSCAHG